ncbi:MAG: hypothetical protein NC543_06025 [bacterium]|nr:hypothetical protein [bacterium]MCM1374527.1 hypothetical protein [Muribaculum sp.]
MKKYLPLLFILILSLILIFKPHSASAMIIRVYFTEISGNSCGLYYTTDLQNSFSETQCIVSNIDYDQKMVEFRLDSSLAGHLTGLRLDLPSSAEQLLCVKNISISSGGVIQREYNPCDFFAEENLLLEHEVHLDLVRPRNCAYLLTGADDPYVVFSSPLVDQIEGCFSHRIWSHILLCLFVVGCYFSATRKTKTVK